MYTINRCPCCDSQNLKSRHAVIAPFVAHYAVRRPPTRCHLCECKQCLFRFFDARFTPEEIRRLYSGYRGPDYFRERHRHEFWYSSGVNDEIGKDPKEIKARSAALNAFLSRNTDVAAIETVLDYGGDRGQFIPPTIGRRKYVFELSDAVPVDGVNRLHSEGEIEPNSFNLVMLCCVLEHCSNPAQMLETLRGFVIPGSLLYVEVPFERYGLMAFAGSSEAYSRYLDLLLTFPPFLTAVDFYSTVARIKLGVVPPLGILKCHEHLNFFDQQSLATLLKRTGFMIVASEIKAIATSGAKFHSLCFLAQRQG